MLRAVFFNVSRDLEQKAWRDDPDDAAYDVATAHRNIDWAYFDGLSTQELCEHATHDFDASADGTTCNMCGSENNG